MSAAGSAGLAESPRGGSGGGTTPSPARRGRSTGAGPLPYVLVAPVIVFIAGLAFVPAVFTIVQSFFTVNALDPPTRFSGLRNFRALAESDAIRSSLANTALYVVVGVVLSTVLGIVMAILLQRPFRGRSLVIAVLILPWALPGVVEGILWSGIFDPNAGLVSAVMNDVGLGGGHLLLGENRVLTIVLIELVQVWQITPLSVLLVLAALQLIPDELYEAAQIDGCSRWGAIRQITLPLARPGIAVCMVQALVATLNVFDQPYVLNGAAATGATVTMQTYFVSFQNLDFGQGYALSLFITVLTLVGSLVIVKAVYRKVEL
ncbi:carbohydrate ABC transporter permease [Microlunatus flavus]|uniref:carbohydrate ABC transporter permease n=1 Tax=Microlunatus flavus TaxID=1036181 RepID=UPI001113C93E|nr:sugar ABC transporter permease [Microlunatus flavus]